MERNECEIKKWRAKNWRLEICREKKKRYGVEFEYREL